MCASVCGAGADAGFRVRGGASVVSRISARGVLKVRPHPIYEKWGGPFRFRSDTFFWHTENIYMYLHVPTCYLGILHTRARMNVKYMPAKVNLLLFFCHPYGRGACALHAPPPPPPPPPLNSATVVCVCVLSSWHSSTNLSSIQIFHSDGKRPDSNSIVPWKCPSRLNAAGN